jgi:pimeloyl-ACP methyl ester carboxylesterase
MTIGEYELSYMIKRAGHRSILFIHGLGCSKDSFLPAFEGAFFPEEYTLLAYDLLGHGSSSKPQNFSYTLEEQSALLTRLLDGLGIEEVTIVAHSMGSVIALLLAENRAGVDIFFCLEGNLVPEDCKISLRVSSLKETDFVSKIFPMAPLKFRCRGLVTEAATAPEAFYRSAKSLVRLSCEGSLLVRYKKLPTRKAYIFGEENRDMPVLDKLGEVDVVKIAGCGHFMMMDNPRDTYSEIARRL